LRVCSICLRVLQDGRWLAAETVILERRSFEQSSPPRFRPVLCADCEQSIDDRRGHPTERLAA
jgi:hypothetical protein